MNLIYHKPYYLIKLRVWIRGANRLKFESEDMEVYKFSEGQKNAVNEARQQIKNGQFLTDDEANKEINEWLSK